MNVLRLSLSNWIYTSDPVNYLNRLDLVVQEANQVGLYVILNLHRVRVRETLPDWILDRADEVELIDISPYALRQRMKHGNIYPPERIDAALNNFFREGNLTALREIALRRVAEKTEAQLQEYMTEHGITEMKPDGER